MQFMDSLPNIVAAVFALIIFYIISRIFKKYIYKLTGKIVRRRSLRNLITNFILFNITLLGVFVALSILNLGKVVTSILAGAGVAGLIIGFAMQEIISNYFSGITIASTEPFSVGDLVEISGTLGTIQKINVRTTVIKTAEGQLVEIPNKDVINNPITNYTVTKERRIDITSGISYEDDPSKARRVAIETISNIKGVNKDKPIEFYYEEYGESALMFVLRFWMDFSEEEVDYFALRSEAIEKLLEAYDKNKITMPYPTTTVKLENS